MRPSGGRLTEGDYERARDAMVWEQIAARGVKDPAVLEAMRRVPRHLFLGEEARDLGYRDQAVSIGYGQTISQPYIVALMSSLLKLRRGQRILEVGSGSGYQSAVLAEMGATVFAVEIVAELAEKARERLNGLGYERVRMRVGDGLTCWHEEAPFDGILVAAAPAEVPDELVDQLETGGRLVMPVGRLSQKLVVVVKKASGVVIEPDIDVRFVPMTGKVAAGYQRGG